jgi:hypothetical protein
MIQRQTKPVITITNSSIRYIHDLCATGGLSASVFRKASQVKYGKILFLPQGSYFDTKTLADSHMWHAAVAPLIGKDFWQPEKSPSLRMIQENGNV